MYCDNFEAMLLICHALSASLMLLNLSDLSVGQNFSETVYCIDHG